MKVTKQLNGSRERLRRPQSIIILSAVVTVIIGMIAGLAIWQRHSEALEEHRRGMNSLGIVLAEQTSRYVQVIDLMLRGVQSQIAAHTITEPADFRRQVGTPSFHTYLVDRLNNVPQAAGVVLIDANGSIVNWSRPEPMAAINTVDRDYFQYFKDHDDPGLFIGSLSKGRASGQLSFFFCRRINGPKDQFFGLVLGIVNVRYLSDFYQAAGEHLKEAVTLLRRDSTMLLRYPQAEPAAGMVLPQSSPWYRRVADGGGSYVGSDSRDAGRTLVSVHPLSDYPLVVDILMETADVYARWYTEAIFIASFAIVAAVASISLAWGLKRQFQRQLEQNAKLEEAAVSLSEGQQILQAYVDMSADWFWEQDENLRFKSCSRLPFMLAPDDMGKTRWDLGDPAMSEERWVAHRVELDARRPFRDFRWERIGSDGTRRFLSTSGDPVFDRAGVFAGYRGTGRNITVETESNARLADANVALEQGRQQFAAVLDNMTQGICFFDRDNRLRLCNRRFIEIYGLPLETQCIGRSIEDLMRTVEAVGTSPDPSSVDYHTWRSQLLAPKSAQRIVKQLKNGRFIASYYQPLADGGWVATHEDVTEHRQAEANIAFLAHHDALTKLPNRVRFREHMEHAIAMAGRGTQFAVMCLDLDNFKQVNDTLGHPAGDGLLTAVAERLQACVREGDTVGRLGGDEFAIIQLGLHHADDAEVLASRIIAAFQRPFDVDGRQIMAGTSIGITVATEVGATYETLMRDADTALYLAKAEGRGTARFFEPVMDARIHMRRLLELDLQEALGRNEFEIYYQPQVNVVANTVSGFEALLRWHHPDRGFISPMDFIPVAEETGMIVAIGAWVLQQACLEAQRWPAEVSVAVNISPVQFRKGDLVATVRAALVASGVPPDRLELEITESVFLRDSAETRNALNALRAMGIRIALDDFGTGYSSLSYLRSFPFSKIKIDQSFIRDLTINKEAMSIVSAVIGLGHNLDMITIAEGVETKEQLDRLRAKGCTEVQGYFFSRPRPADEILALIDHIQYSALTVL